MDNSETIELTKIVGGGQTMGELADGRKCFVWGGLPGETVKVRIIKRKSRMAEAIVSEVLTPSPDRISPKDPESYLSTSPWQIMKFDAEQRCKAQLIKEAFDMHHVSLPGEISLYSDGNDYGYRNKIEFSFFGDLDPTGSVETLDLAFFKRGGKGKIPVESTSLAKPDINRLAQSILSLLESKNITARQLKTLIVRCDQSGNCVWQLYFKEKLKNILTDDEANSLPAQGGEVIYSDPRSPASRISERLTAFGDTSLQDKILGINFRYPAESFFQINIPIYEQTLRDMRIHAEKLSLPIVDMYSGVGSIGLTIGGPNVTLVEIDENAVREMRENISRLDTSAQAILAPSEKALEHIMKDKVIIVDPPRAGLHADVVDRLVEAKPPRIIYLSCNPVTQARDVALLQDTYKISHHHGYNFFPRTPHIEHLVVLDLKR